MSTLDPRVRALVDAARAAEPSAADRARVRAALAGRLGPAAPSSVTSVTRAGAETPPHPAAHPLASAPAGVGAKLLAAGALIGAVGFGGGMVTGRARAPGAELARHGAAAEAFRRALAVERVAVPAPPAPTGKAVATEPAPPGRTPTEPAPAVVASSPDAHAPARPPGTPAAAEPKASTLVEETDLLRKAQTALAAGDAAAALTRIDALGARHPDGQLREERLAARVAALCAMGREGEARREADRFLAEAPQSIHAARVRASCAFAPKGGR